MLRDVRVGFRGQFGDVGGDGSGGLPFNLFSEGLLDFFLFFALRSIDDLRHKRTRLIVYFDLNAFLDLYESALRYLNIFFGLFFLSRASHAADPFLELGQFCLCHCLILKQIRMVLYRQSF